MSPEYRERVSPLEDQRSGLKRPCSSSWSRTPARFSAGRPAEWIETAHARDHRLDGQVSPLEDQRSGLKPVLRDQRRVLAAVSPLEDQRSEPNLATTFT